MKRIDLTPEEIRKSSARRNMLVRIVYSRFVRITVLAICIYGLICAGQLLVSRKYELESVLMKKEIQSLEQTIHERAEEYGNLDDQHTALKRNIDELQTKLDVLQAAHRKSFVRSKELVRLAGLVPEGLWLSKIAIVQDAVTVTGSAISNALVSTFMTSVDGADSFYNTGFTYTQKDVQQDHVRITFEVVTSVRGTQPEE